ncbi:hypothetical protein [Mycobacterium phage WXIN]|nr:hypothetical protein [Mycobacterium phage WXIN]
MSAATVLASSCEFLSDPKHWHQGDFHSADEKAFCAIGTIMRYAQPDSPDYWHAVDALGAAIGPYSGPISITAWNDDPDRQHSEVVEAFQRALALAVSNES